MGGKVWLPCVLLDAAASQLKSIRPQQAPGLSNPLLLLLLYLTPCCRVPGLFAFLRRRYPQILSPAEKQKGGGQDAQQQVDNLYIGETLPTCQHGNSSCRWHANTSPVLRTSSNDNVQQASKGVQQAANCRFEAVRATSKHSTCAGTRAPSS
jgi:hypothetical protein